MTKKKDTVDDKRIDELLISVNSIQENMADKQYVADMVTQTLKKYHETYNPSNLVVTKPSGMVVSGEQESGGETPQRSPSGAGPEKKEGPLAGLGGWAKVAEDGISLIKTVVVPARDPRFDAIENMSLDIVTNSVTGLVKRISGEAMRSGATIHSGMTLEGHKD